MADTDVLTARAIVPAHVAHREIGDETIVLNLDTGRYHRLNRTAGSMLATLVESPSVGDAARALAERYGRPVGEIEADLSQLCASLAERGLVELVDER
jgi:Coenzyme PQQ synthesis protein D (PqqD)